MAYQLRSRKDPAVTGTQEQTDTPVGHLTEIQVTTLSQTMFVPPQLSDIEHEALPIPEASQPQTGLDTSTKPETPTSLQLDTKGPTRLDPGLGSATLSVGATLTGTHLATQQLAPAQVSAVIPSQLPPADTVGPPSAVSPSRDTSLTGNQTSQLDETIYSTFLPILSDSQEVKHITQAGTTLVSGDGAMKVTDDSPRRGERLPEIERFMGRTSAEPDASSNTSAALRVIVLSHWPHVWQQVACIGSLIYI